MKRIAIILFSVLAISCAKQADPLEDAIGAYALQGQEGEFRLYSIEKIDSTTFRTEFERRENVFALKLREETKLYDKYKSQRKVKNAARHLESIYRTREVITGLDSLKTLMTDRLDEVAYYDYVFSGKSKAGDMVTEFKDAYAAVTPDLKVIAMTSDKKDLHKTGGRVIPGYVEMLGSGSEESDATEVSEE